MTGGLGNGDAFNCLNCIPVEERYPRTFFNLYIFGMPISTDNKMKLQPYLPNPSALLPSDN